MPEMIPVGNTNYVPPPNSGLDTLSSILGIQQRKQALISGQLGIQSQQAELVARQQKAKEIQAGVPLMVDPVGNGITDKEGNPTADAYKIIKQAMPMTGDEHYKDILANATANLQYKNTWMGMSRDVRNDVSARVAAVAADETGGQKAGLPEYNAMLDNIEADYKGTPAEAQVNKLTSITRNAITKSGESHGMDGMQHVALAFSRGGLGNAGITGPNGVATPQATTQDQGGQMQPGVTAPALAGGGFTPTGQPNRKTIPPGFELTEDPLTHNKYLWNRQSGQTRPFGTGAPVGVGGPAAPGAPPAAPPQRQLGEAAAQEAQVNTNFQSHQANVKAASAANQQLDQIKNVVGLLDEGVKTGSGAVALTRAEQTLSNVPGLGGLASADSQSAKLDLLNKFLERIGADYGSLNGSPAKTDAGAESLRSQIGSTGYNANALRDVMKYTAAQYQAAKAKDTAEQNFLGQKGNGILNQDQFEKQWRNSYEPRVYQLANEPKEVAKAAIQKMDPADRAAFMKKYAELKAMGAAPQ